MHALKIIENVARSNPERIEAHIPQKRIAPQITLRISAHRMRLAINLDRQPAFETRKINDVAMARKLTAEAQSLGSLTKVVPQHHLWESELAAKLARETNVRL